MPFGENNKKSNPGKNRKQQINNVRLKRESDELKLQLKVDDEIDSEDSDSFVEVEIEDWDSDFDNELLELASQDKTGNFSSKCKSNELKQKFILDFGHIKNEDDHDIQTAEDGSNIYTKKIKLENNSDSEHDFSNNVPKGQNKTISKVKKTEFKISQQEIAKESGNVKSASEIKIEIDSDSENTPLQAIKKEVDTINSVQQIKIEKDTETQEKSNVLASVPKIDNISVGEIKIEDGTYKTSSASEDEYTDSEVQLDFKSECGVGGNIKNSCEDDIPSTSRAHLRKIKEIEKVPVKVKEERNNETDSEQEDSQIPSNDEEFLSTASGGEEFLSESEEESPDNENLSLENIDVVTQLIDEYHKRPQLWFEDLSTELSVLKENQLYRSIKDSLNKKFNTNYSLKRVKMLVKLLLEQYEKEIERQLQDNEETTPESSKLWFYDKFNFLKDDVENKVKLKLESSIRLLNDNILAKLIDIYKNYDSLWDKTHSSFPDRNKRHKTMLAMCLEIKQKLRIKFNTFKLESQLLKLHKKVQVEKRQIYVYEKNKVEYKPIFPLIAKCDFLANHLRPFKCRMCMKVCKTWHQFKQHKALHDGSQPFECTVCGLVCKTRLSLYFHNYRHNGVNYNCSICGKNFAYPFNLRTHIKDIHTNHGIFNCQVCGEGFDYPEDIEKHKKEKHNEVSVKCKCGICGKVFQSEAFLKIHNISYKNRNYGCSMCEKKFHNQSTLRTHMQLVHWSCKICKEMCTDQKSVNQHVASLHQGKEFCCNICGKGYVSVRYLKIHHRNIHDQNNLQCKTCGKLCKNRTTLTYHRLTHKEKKYDCTICKKSFLYERFLKDHMLSHEKKLTCRFCGKNFADRGYMNQHQKGCKKRNNLKK